MSASTRCPHSSISVHINVAAFGNTNIRYAEVTGHCELCEAPIRFRGLPVGMSPNAPACDFGATEARLPFMLGDEEYDGNASGYSVKVVGR